MQTPTYHVRKSVQAEVNKLLRVPDFHWPDKRKAIFSVRHWSIWVGLGAMTTKAKAARRQLFVQARLLTLYDTTIELHEEEPLLMIDSDAFLVALHHRLSKIDPDISDYLAPTDLGLVLKLYNTAFANRIGFNPQANQRSIRSQLRAAAAKWQGVLRALRREKNEKKKKEEKAKNVMSLVMLPGRPLEFEPARLDGETDGAYILRLQGKVRELRCRVREKRLQVQGRDARIAKMEIKIQELDQLLDDEEDDDED